MGAQTDLDLKDTHSFTVPAIFLSDSAVLCNVSLNYSVDISISLDGSKQSYPLKKIVFDSQCDKCDESRCIRRVCVFVALSVCMITSVQ